MANNPKPDDQGVADQSAYPRFYGYISSEESRFWNDVWNKLALKAVVSTANWTGGLDADLAYEPVVGRVRTPNDVGVSGE